MGYTRYFSFKPVKKGEALKVEKQYQLALKAIRKLARNWNENHLGNERLSGYSAHETKVEYDGILINGKGENAHEDFVLRAHYKQNLNKENSLIGSGFHFCKTAQKPYDTVITASLAILKYYLGKQIDIDSDGRYKDFQEGTKLVKKVLRLGVENPLPKPERCEVCQRLF